jgi:hypothetical protein
VPLITNSRDSSTGVVSTDSNGCWLWGRLSPRRSVAAANGGDGIEGPVERRDTAGASYHRGHRRIPRVVGEAHGQGNRQWRHLAGGDEDSFNSISLGSIPSRRRKMTARRRPIPGGLQRGGGDGDLWCAGCSGEQWRGDGTDGHPSRTP